MTININGYNENFQAFVDFAQQRVNANDGKAIADARFNVLAGRSVLAIGQSLTDNVHKWKRKSDEIAVNDRTRDLFKKAVISMFGSEAKIFLPQ